jgi:hypothetical protein
VVIDTRIDLLSFLKTDPGKINMTPEDDTVVDRGVRVRQLQLPVSVAFVPGYPNVFVVALRNLADPQYNIGVYEYRREDGGTWTRLCTGCTLMNKLSLSGNIIAPYGVRVVITHAKPPRIVVTDPFANRLHMFSLTVTCNTWSLASIQEIGDGVLENPIGLALRRVCDTSDETILVVEKAGRYVSEWTLDGVRLRQFGSSAFSSDPLTHRYASANVPITYSIAVLPVSDQIVVVAACPGIVTIIDGASGVTVSTFLCAPNAPNHWHPLPCFITADEEGHIFVFDYMSTDLTVYNADGTVEYRFSVSADNTIGEKSAAWLDGEDGPTLVVALSHKHRVSMFKRA